MDRSPSQSFPAIEQEDSIAPPAPSNVGDRESGMWVVEQVQKARRESRTALTLATTAVDGVRRIEASIGHSPDPARGMEGDGLFGVVSTLADGMKLDREDRGRRRAAWVAAGKGAAVAIGAVAAVFGILSKIFHW